MKVRRTDRGVGITVGDVGGWKILFGGGRGGSLEAGKYLNARRYPFSGDAPGIEFTGYGRGCNTITGRFVVWEFETEQSGSLRLAIDFQQRCEDEGPSPLRGHPLQLDVPLTRRPVYGLATVVDMRASEPLAFFEQERGRESITAGPAVERLLHRRDKAGVVDKSALAADEEVGLAPLPS